MSTSTSAGAPRQARYRAIESYLRGLVDQARPGDPLPSEADLCALFSVSRMTVRQALAVLSNEGMVERRRGQGTFVGHRLLHRQPGLLMSFTDEMTRRGLTPSSQILSAQLETASEVQAAELGLVEGSRVVRIIRVRCADGEPVAIEDVALIPSLAPVLESDLVAGSLHRAIAALGVRPTRAVGSLTARLADPAEAELMGLTQPASILVEMQVMFDEAGMPFERTETAYAGERYAVDTIHTRP